MTIEDFQKLKRGTIVHLYYHCYNTGDFEWKHSHVEADRVFGQFKYKGDKQWSEIGGYLYEFGGHVCRGSGAEPVFRRKQEADSYFKANVTE